MQLEIDGKIYQVEIIKKNNRNTYIRVKNGKIIVTTNYLTSGNSIVKLIKDNKKSILNMIKIDDKKREKADNFYYFGKKYDIVYGFNEIEFTDDKIYATSKVGMDKYILESLKKIYQERMDYWYHRFEEKIPRPKLKIRKMTTRWGVCNIRSHDITLNYHLVNYDISCLDYVIVHELSHLIYPNHSRGFWNLVLKYYPNYKEKRKMLKE